MRDQHERPDHEEGTAGSHAVLYTVRVQDAAASHRPMRSLVAVGGLLLVIVVLGAWFRWNVEAPPAGPAWAIRTAPPPPASATAPVPTPNAPEPSPSLGRLALGIPRQLLALSEPGAMATSDVAAFVAGFAFEGGSLPAASPGRCGTPFLWPVTSIQSTAAAGIGLGSVASLGATASGRLVGIGRTIECTSVGIAFGETTPNSSSWQIVPDLVLPWSTARHPAWIGEPPAAAGNGNGPREVVAWVADPDAGTTYRSVDDGRTWETLSGVRPLGWDASGALWYVTSEETLPDRQRASLPPPVNVIGVGAEAAQREPGVIFGHAALLNSGRQVERMVLGGSGGPETAIVLADSRFAANGRVVAIVGGGGESLRPTVAISLDGMHFVRRLLPPELATDPSAILGVALAPDAVLVQAADTAGPGTIVWAIPISGVPPIPVPSPSPQEVPQDSPAAMPEPGQLTLPPAPSYPPAVATSTWSRIDVTPSATGGGLLAGSGWNVFATGAGTPGFVGFDSLAADRIVHVLRSGDGTSWTKVADLPDSSGAHIAGLAHDGDRYVAVGQQCDPACEPAAWRSKDLTSWSKAVVKGGAAGMTCVTAGAHGFVAGGSSADVGVPLWTSPDGSTWTRIGSWAAFLGETGILSVAETADGYIVHGTLDGRTTAWTSTDGLTWHRVDLALDGMLLAVIHGSRGFLAVGTRAEGGQAMFGADASGVAWTSDDGLHWLRAEVPALAASVVAGAAEGPGGYVAVGLRRSAASMESAMWTSRDGLAWSAVAGVDVRSAGLFTNAASDGRHLVVAMETGISVTQLRPTVWISDGIVR